ncbi:MAG: DUF423 domain-containing protein, partial [Hyphomicrobium sp.]
MAPMPPGLGGPPGGALALVLGAGLMGAAGVALSAVAAHHTQSPALITAAMMLMVHAAAVLAIAAFSCVADRGPVWRSAGVLMLAAVALFSGDVTLH